jgi:hypothetical protein
MYGIPVQAIRWDRRLFVKSEGAGGGNLQHAGSRVEWNRGLVGKPFIVKRKCSAQKDICQAIAACLRGAIVYVEDAPEIKGGRIAFDYDRCDGYSQCVTAYCGAAIEMQSLPMPPRDVIGATIILSVPPVQEGVGWTIY